MECSIPENTVLLSSGQKSFSSWDNLRPQEAKLRWQDISREENWVNSGWVMPSEPIQRNQKHTWCHIPAWAHAPEWLMQGRPEMGVSESLRPYLQLRDLIHLQSSTFLRAATAASSRISTYSENLRSLYLSSMNWFYSDWRQPDICCTLAHALLGMVLTAGSCREGWGRRSRWQGQAGRCRITCRSLASDKTLQQPCLWGIGGRVASTAAFPQQLPLNSWGEVREGFWETCRCQVLEPGEGLKELSPRLGSKCRSGHRNKGTWPPSLHATVWSSEHPLGLAWLGRVT